MNDPINAPFLCASEQRCHFEHPISAPYLRREFDLTDFESAELYVCGLGFYELFVNGHKITKGKLAPYISNTNHLVYYDRYDLVTHLHHGKNVIGILLGNGFQNDIGGYPWGFSQASWSSCPKLSMTLLVDGICLVSTAEPMRWAPSPIYCDALRSGEYYDARLEQPGWNAPGFDDSKWQETCPTSAPQGKRTLCHAHPIVCSRELLPIAKWCSDNAVIVDFGINTAGICRIHHRGYPGQKLIFRHFEGLLENRAFYNRNTCTPDFNCDLSQKDILVCSGNDDIFEPSFTYHGFRYVMVEGIDLAEMEEDFITMLVLHGDFPEAGHFSCSDKWINRIQEISLNSLKSNFFYFPTDCPQREKNGWTDSAMVAASQLWSMNCSASLAVWLDNIRKAQDRSGRLPGVVPTDTFAYQRYNGPGWDRVIVELPWQILRFTGNLRIVEENADAIWQYLNFLQTQVNENGLIGFGLPDWLEPGALSEGDSSTPVEITDTLVVLDMLEKAAFLFARLSQQERSNQCRSWHQVLLQRFRSLYICGAQVDCSTQTAQAMAIAKGVFPPDQVADAVHILVRLIERDGLHFRTGTLGMEALFGVLSNHGHADLCYQILTQPTAPGYRYWLEHGATSMWECFNEVFDNSILRRDGGRTLSLNHICWCQITAWFYRFILGLNINPDGTDPCNFEVRPCQVTAISHAEGSYRSDQGEIHVSWHRDDVGTPIIHVRTNGNFHYRIIA